MCLKNSDLNSISSMLLFIALVLIVVFSNTTLIPLVLLVASLALTIILLVRRKTTRGEPESDERSKKIGAFGLSCSWIIGVSGVVLLFWADYFGILKPGSLTLLGVPLFLFLVSAAVFVTCRSQKGDSIA